MSDASRRRLARLIRGPDPDLAEAALLVCVEIEPDLRVDDELRRLEAFAETLRSRGVPEADPADTARALADHLAGDLGFTGDREVYYTPRNALLTRVLDRRRGLPITLSIIYVAVARRLGVPAFGIGLPGHFVAGIGPEAAPVVLDPFHDGEVLTEETMARRVEAATGGRARFDPAMLTPAPPAAVIRRLLNNLTRDFAGEGDFEGALWTVELKELLPGGAPGDRRDRGRILHRLGRYRRAARALESYLEEVPDAADADGVAALARQCRAAMN